MNWNDIAEVEELLSQNSHTTAHSTDISAVGDTPVLTRAEWLIFNKNIINNNNKKIPSLQI